jgi:glycerophosphoryl diester phosphodiesterase
MKPSKKILVALVFAVALAAVFVINENGTPEKLVERTALNTISPNRDILTVAHRGASIFAPESTLPAIEQAIVHGFDYVELDVRYSADGVPILLHDDTVDRTTDGAGHLSTLTLAELKELDAGSWYGDEYEGTRIPTLEEALAVMQGKICAFWDTKDTPDKTTVQLFIDYGFDRNCLLISFGGLGESRRSADEFPRQIVKFWPEAPLVPLVRKMADLEDVLKNYPNSRGVFLLRTHLDDEVIAAAHANGLLVFSIAINQPDHHHVYKYYMDKKVDIFMLDHIDSFQGFLATGDLSTPISEPPPNSGYFTDPEPQQ